MAPTLIGLVGRRRFEALERRGPLAWWRALGWTLGSIGAALAALVLTLPLWLIPPLALLLPPLILGWLTYRVMAHDVLAEHADVAGEVRRQYRHFVVDEYQDVSPLQQALLDLWRGDSEELCVVGDPAQTIHAFAGARSDFLTGFSQRHPGATRIALVRDYRSTPQVVSLANRVMAGQPEAMELRAQRPAGPEPVIAGSDSETGEEGGTHGRGFRDHRAIDRYAENIRLELHQEIVGHRAAIDLERFQGDS